MIRKLEEKDLEEVDQAIGDPKVVESFTVYALQLLGASVTQDFEGYKIQVKDEKLLFNIISKSFMQRRKTLSNVLINNNIMHSKEDVKNMWKELEIDENVRGESLTLEQFGKIADYISEKK